MRLGSPCALLWSILTRCTRKQVTQNSIIPGRLNGVADKLSRLSQTIQTEWSLLPEVFQTICSRWHRPKIDLFAMRLNNKLPLFVSPVPDPLATSSGCIRSAMGGSGRIRPPTSSHIGQSGGEVARLPMQENHSDFSGVAQHALVLGSSGHVQPNPTEPAHSAQPVGC